MCPWGHGLRSHPTKHWESTPRSGPRASRWGPATSSGRDGRAARVSGSLQLRSCLEGLGHRRQLSSQALPAGVPAGMRQGCPGASGSTGHVRTTVSRKSRDRLPSRLHQRPSLPAPATPTRPRPSGAAAHAAAPDVASIESAGAAHRPCAPNTHIHPPKCTQIHMCPK